jgi:flagellar motor switch/type III secretory pathway protein FliN
MAKADKPPPDKAAPEKAAAAGGGWGGKLILGFVALLATAGGAVVPHFLLGGGAKEEVVRPRLETLVRDLPVEVSVTLGNVELPLAELSRLREGDVVILNQRTSEPLTALVAGARRFRVWPGRLGSQQAFRIESLIEC